MQVLSTKEYDKFSYINGNREVNGVHVAMLRKAMRENTLISPIIVNEHLEIIDWQHRFQALRELWKEVKYIVCEWYWVDEVVIYNKTMVTRSLKDYICSHANQWNDNYKKLWENFLDQGTLKIHNYVALTIAVSNKSWYIAWMWFWLLRREFTEWQYKHSTSIEEEVKHVVDSLHVIRSEIWKCVPINILKAMYLLHKKWLYNSDHFYYLKDLDVKEDVS